MRERTAISSCLEDGSLDGGVEWRPVIGCPNYEVSNTGLIRSITGRNRGNLMRTYAQRNGGHLRLELRGEAGTRKYLVHVLVARAFLGEPPDGHEVCHEDGDPTNNRLSNLRYDTKAANALDRARHGRDSQANKTHGDCGHELAGANLVRGALNRRAGRSGRNCRACGCGRLAAKREGITDPAEVRTVCDVYFAVITRTGRPHGAISEYRASLALRAAA